MPINNENIVEENVAAIEAYLEENDLESQSTGSGLHYIVEVEGNGMFPSPTSTITIFYSGYDLDGNIFDQTQGNTPATFPLQNLIPGWQEGIPKFSVGGRGKLIVPSHLAYGSQFPSLNQPIVFDIELVAID